MRAHPTAVAARRHPAAVLGTLLLGTIVTGTAEVVTTGLLPQLSSGLAVPVTAAGALFSVYALGLAIGGPMLTVLTMRRDRRHVLVGSMTLFAVLVAAPAAVPDFGWFVATRVAAGALQGVFLAAAFATATAVVHPSRAGRALAIVIAGFSLSTLLGLPLGVLAGAVVGWRGVLLGLGGAAALVAVLVLTVAPAVPGSAISGARGLRHALAPRVLAVLALTTAVFTASGAVTGYLVPVLQQVTGVSGPLVSAVLVGYGAANLAGSLTGGRLSDSDAARALVLVTLGMVAAIAVLLSVRGEPLLAVAALGAWGLLAASAPAPLQHRSMRLAGPAGGLVAALPASAANAGLALGSTASGIAYAAAGTGAVILVGLGSAVGALALALATRRLRPPAARIRPAVELPAVESRPAA
jgi:DHA1 family inner membrane transport protein